MAPNSRDDLERVVFSTRVQTDKAKHEWQDSGALEIGRGKDASGKELLVVSKVVYRAFALLTMTRCSIVYNKALFLT